MVERENYTIVDYICANVVDGDWANALYSILPILLFTVHISHKHVSYELLFGLPAQWGPIVLQRKVCIIF